MDNGLQQSCYCLAAEQPEVVKGNLVQLQRQALNLVHFSPTNKNFHCISSANRLFGNFMKLFSGPLSQSQPCK